MIKSIIQKQILIHNDTNLIPVYRQGELDNATQILAKKTYRHLVHIAHRIDDAIVSTWEK